jgi:transcriptional regulator with XRE-family HTH domain
MKTVIPPRRRKPMKLAGKLLRIREMLGLTQGELLDQLDFGPPIKQQHISAWEKGIREPDLVSLISYARGANICLDVLIDDEYDLPEELPSRKTFHPHSR